MDPKLPWHRRLPSGPPLHLETPGRATAVLTPFLLPVRLERFRAVLARRTRYLTALIEEVHDRHNIAACVRSCDAFGLQDLHVIPREGEDTRLSRNVAGGSHRRITVHRHDGLEAAVDALRARGYRLVVTDLGGDGAEPETPETVPVDAPICVAFGNEATGISDALRAAADVRLRIPMRGFVESFNISVACAVTLYALRRRIDLEVPAARRALTPEEAADILDRWVVDDVPHAMAVIDELAKRHRQESPS